MPIVYVIWVPGRLQSRSDRWWADRGHRPCGMYEAMTSEDRRTLFHARESSSTDSTLTADVRQQHVKGTCFSFSSQYANPLGCCAIGLSLKVIAPFSLLLEIQWPRHLNTGAGTCVIAKHVLGITRETRNRNRTWKLCHQRPRSAMTPCEQPK
jgi:hypothetical protein